MNTRRYAIWNNKGGVGKSTITFHVASRFAEKNSDKDVLVIDLCPQSNASMMMLGGGTKGESHVLSMCTAPTPQTVVGYASAVIAGGAGAPLPDPNSFVVKVKNFNCEMPDNLYLLCGDGNLEPMAPAISQAASAPALTTRINPWKWVHEVFLRFIESFADKRKRDLFVFIDTNPSFSIYTELAISASERLITPVNADDSSRVAANAMFILLHGQTPPHPIYGSWTFAAQAVRNGLAVPEIHLIVGNRLTQYGGAAAAFTALSDATADALYKNYVAHPGFFTGRTVPPKNLGDFRSSYSVALRDFNTAGVVAAHVGAPLSAMKDGYYPVHNSQARVNARDIRNCSDAVDDVLNLID